MWVVASSALSCQPVCGESATNIIPYWRLALRAASSSVWPGQGWPAAAQAALLMGAVTMPSNSPARVASMAALSQAKLAAPLAALSAPGCRALASHGMSRMAGSWAGAAPPSACWVRCSASRLPNTVMSATDATAGSARLLSSTSGPMPAGSPQVSARRGRPPGAAAAFADALRRLSWDPQTPDRRRGPATASDTCEACCMPLWAPAEGCLATSALHRHHRGADRHGNYNMR